MIAHGMPASLHLDISGLIHAIDEDLEAIVAKSTYSKDFKLFKASEKKESVKLDQSPEDVISSTKHDDIRVPKSQAEEDHQASQQKINTVSERVS